MKERIQYFDLLRGIAIIAVVTIHANGIGYKFSNESFNFVASIVLRQIVNFGVPLFLAVSGYFLATKNVSTKDGYLSFLKKQLPRILLPFVIWSLFYTGYNYVVNGTHFINLLMKLLTFQAAAPLYYILLISQFYILLPVLQKLGNNRSGLIFSLFVSLLTCILVYYVRYYTSIKLPLVLYAGNFPLWLVFFVLGIYLKNHTVKITLIWLIIICLIAMTLSILETWYTYRTFGDITDSVTAAKCSSFLWSFFIIILLFSNKSQQNYNFLAGIGELSFGIYFMHMFVLWIITPLFSEFLPYIFANTIISQFIIVTLTILVCYVSGLVLKFYKQDIAIKYLGF